MFNWETLGDGWGPGEERPAQWAQGILRAVAQIRFGGQTDATVRMALEWLRNRKHLTGGQVLQTLAELVNPALLVEKSPSVGANVDAMSRIHRAFPNARYIHLVRHPIGYAESVFRALLAAEKAGDAPEWLRELACSTTDSLAGASYKDPQDSWYQQNRAICTFLANIPKSNKRQIRGEVVLANPDCELRGLAEWLDLRCDPSAIEEMKHPERSPFACFGPTLAIGGNDPFFLSNPALRPARRVARHLDGPVPWRPDGGGFSPHVKQLAASFGYV